MDNKTELVIKNTLDAWHTYLARTNKLFDELQDDDLQREVAPGRNTGIYLLGHLTAVHDGMLPLLGIAEKSYPQLEEVFLRKPDKSGLDQPSIAQLKHYWKNVNDKLSDAFSHFTMEDWFSKHTLISADDFKNEPNRNKLNVVMNRTNHLAYHLAQLVFLKK